MVAGLSRFKRIMKDEWNQERSLDSLLTLDFIKTEEDCKVFTEKLAPSLRLSSLASIKDKRILVLGELGYGDCIWLYRYVKKLSEFAKSIVFVTCTPLLSLFREDVVNSNLRNLEITSSIENIKYDRFSWLLDLPSLFNFDFLTTDKYINIPSEKIIEGSIGVCLGNTDMDEASWYRNCPLELLPNIVRDSKEVYNFSNQVTKYKNIRGEVRDFLDTARYIKRMEYFVCTDNVLLNLAGALGVRTFGLFNSTCTDEWIWNVTNNEGTGWYESIIPFICKDYGNWTEAVTRMVTSKYFTTGRFNGIIKG